jgi:integrase
MTPRVFKDFRPRSDGSPIWCIAYEGADGKRHRERTQAPTKELAKILLSAKLKDVIAMKAKGADTLDPITLADYAPRYEAHVRARKPEMSARRDLDALRLHLLPVFGKLLLDKIHTGMVQTYVDRRLGRDNGRGGRVTPSTVHTECMVLSAVFREAMKSKHALVNPVRGVTYPEISNVIERVLSVEEERLLFKLASPELRPILTTALYAGLRKGELLNLTWEQVDFARGVIHVRPRAEKHADSNPERVDAWAPKRRKSRIVPMHELVREALKRLPRAIREPYVFITGRHGRRWTESGLNTVWYALLSDARIDDLRFHDTRHTFATRLSQAGVPLQAIQIMLGHSKIATTARYSHLGEADLRAGIALLAPLMVRAATS